MGTQTTATSWTQPLPPGQGPKLLEQIIEILLGGEHKKMLKLLPLDAIRIIQ